MNEIIELHSNILDLLITENKINPNFRFGLRSRDDKSGRLRSGYWFLGNEKYLTIPLSSRTSGDTVNKSIIFVLTQSGSKCSLIVNFKNEKDQEVINCYKKILNNIDGFEKNNETHFTKNYLHKDYVQNIKDFTLKDQGEINQIIISAGLENKLFIQENDFKRKLNRVLNLREDLNENGGNNYILEILNSTYGKSEKIINDIYNTGSDIVHAKWSTLNKSKGYSFTLSEKNIQNYENYKVTKVLLCGEQGYYLIPFNSFKTFLNDFGSLPEDKRQHFTINLEDHILSGGGTRLDLKNFFGDKTSINSDLNYFSYNSTKSGIIDKSPTGTEEFVFEGIYINESISKVNDIVFFAQHGDKPTWEPGLSAICKLTKEPYNKGYWKHSTKNKSNYFKVKLTPVYILPKVLDRLDFMGYFDCYDIPFIGPKLKNEANQANQKIRPEQAQNIVGVLLDYFPDDIDLFNEIFGSNFSIRAQKATIGNNSKPHKQKLILTDIKVNPIKNEQKNLILYGAPGTGKSYELKCRVEGNKNKVALFPDKSLRSRITFHPNYSYRNFVGSYKPKPLYKETDKKIYKTASGNTHNFQNKEPLIEYVFEPGPFLEMYVKAYHNPEHNFVLVIEEINRANTAAVFGDVFQLLDRDVSGKSEYPITLEQSAHDFLKENEIYDNEIALPSNLYLWATMNNADQGVMPMDSAFKRRWSFEHLRLNEFEKEVEVLEINFPWDEKVKWNSFRKTINDKLSELKIHEDKFIGPFFMNAIEIQDNKAVLNKLLLYLKEDVLRYKSGVFSEDLKTFSDISEKFLALKGNPSANVFSESISFETIIED
jgi:5-methylcytosine-specific restriction protein B